MSYFDAVRCSSCHAAFDPEKVAVRGRVLKCPSCSAELRLTDLFGVADAFSEEAPPDLTLDDLVPGGSGPSAPRSEPSPDTTLPVRRGSALDIARSLRDKE